MVTGTADARPLEAQVSTPQEIAKISASVDEALKRLHTMGVSPVEAIKALRDGRGLPFAEGKKALHSSPSWSEEARCAEKLHDELLGAFDAEGDGL